MGSSLPFQKHDPPIAVSSTGDSSSFAYETARARWPKILSTAASHIRSTFSTSSSALSEEDLKAASEIAERIDALKEAMAADAPLEPIPDDGHKDIKKYNDELANLGGPTWRNAPWLFAECYLYRLIHTFFTTSIEFWQTYDIFRDDKRKALVGSKKGTTELVKRFLGVLAAIESNEAPDESKQKALFEEMIQISLWGNATDLSLLTSMSIEELDSRQGKAAREKSRENVIVDDTDQVWTLLWGLKKAGNTGEIHIALDNAGFELLADLVLASYLLESGYATKITLHGKRMPWFVSDVNPTDLTDLVNGFAIGTLYEGSLDAVEAQELQQAGRHWQGLMQQGKLRFEAHPFWTTQHSYGRMPDVEPQLYQRLSEAELVIYKGDLHYRKITYDGLWPKTTPFKQAIGPLAEKRDGKGVRTLALRTAKADVGVGLREGLEGTLPGDWTRTGKFAMVSFWDGKS